MGQRISLKAVRVMGITTVLLVLMAELAVPAWAVSTVTSGIYWSNSYGNSIGRADLDGTNANQGLISGPSLAYIPEGVTVDASHVYWTNGTSTIGRADLDGLNANQNFITNTGGYGGMAVDANYLYWANSGTLTNYGKGAIGRADLDGLNADPNFIAGAGSFVKAVAVDANHIYWTHHDDANNVWAIGRANLDGSNVNNDFITGGSDEFMGIAVDAGHLYWAIYSPGAIGRADLDGTNVNAGFITGVTNPVGVAVDPAHIYWASFSLGTIGRADLDGSNADENFITGGDRPWGVAVAAPASGSLVVTDCNDPFLQTVTYIDGDLIVDGVTNCTAVSLPNLQLVNGDVKITNNSALTTIDLSSVSTGGSITITDNGGSNIDLSASATGGNVTVTGNGVSTIDLSSSATGGNVDITSTGTGTYSLGDGSTGGNLDLDAGGYTTVSGTTANGDTNLTIGTAEADMTVHIGAASFISPVPFSITALDSSTLTIEDGFAANGSDATIDPLVGIQYVFTTPTLNQDATLTFDVNFDSLDIATQTSLLAGLAAGSATLVTKSDAPDSVYQAFNICPAGVIPLAGGCVVVETLDANGQPTAGTPSIVRFSNVVGHFSTWAVALVKAKAIAGNPSTSTTSAGGSGGGSVSIVTLLFLIAGMTVFRGTRSV